MDESQKSLVEEIERLSVDSAKAVLKKEDALAIITKMEE